MSDFICHAPNCPLAGADAKCAQWLDGCAQGAFRKIVSQFSMFGDWNVREWSIGSGKYYAKLFGPNGFVTIEDYTWKGRGFRVAIRLRQPKGKCEWRDREGLSVDDGSLSDAVAWGCNLAGIEERI